MNVLVYLLQATACTAVFYLFYYLFLKRLTFFVINRWYLLGTLIVSFIIPLLTIQINEPPAYVGVVQQAVYTYVPEPVVPKQLITQQSVIKSNPINWMGVLKLTYLLTVIALTIHLLVTLAAFFSRIKGKRIAKIGKVNILSSSPQITNGSFLNYIFLNDQELSADEIKQIIAHEMLHVKLYHSADRIIVKIAQIILWFNPFIYFYLRSVEENHEFEVDREIARSTDKHNYANLLLHLSVAGQGMLYHNFSKVPLKKRITMLFNKPSTNMKKTIYVLIVPVVLISCLAFAKIKNAQSANLKFNQFHHINDTVKYRQKIKRTAEDERRYKKGYEAFKAYRQSDEYKNKLKLCSAIAKQTITATVKKIVQGNITPASGFISGKLGGVLIDYKGNDYLIEPGYNNNIIKILKPGDVVTLQVFTSSFTKDQPVFITPAYVTKDNKKIFEMLEAKSPDYPFLYEANKVRFAEGEISQIKKYANGNWKTALFETANGYQFNVFFKPTSPDLTSISEGDHVRLRFVHEVKTGAKSYSINDWVSITTNIRNYGIQNPELFPKFYEEDKTASANKRIINNSVLTMSAEDSTYFDKTRQITNLYGNAHVKFADFDLTAAYIRIDDKNHSIFASGSKNPANQIYQGRPILKSGNGSKPATSDSIFYNYKTKTGKTWN